MRSNLEDNRSRRMRHRSVMYDTVSQTLTGTYVLGSDAPTYQFLDGGSSDRTVQLPAIEPGGGQQYWIANTGTTNVLNVTDSGGVAIGDVPFGDTAVLYSSATAWKRSVGSSASIPSTYAIGDLLFASTTSVLSRLADVATGNTLLSGGVGVAPAWGKVGLTTHISGILGVANGGTAISSYAVGDMLYASAAAVLSKLAAVAVGSVLASAGVTTAPIWSTAPSLTISLTVPLVVGGTGVASTLALRATSGVGAGSEAVIIQVGSNGATEVARFNSIGLGIGITPTVGGILLTLSSDSVTNIQATSYIGSGVSGTQNQMRTARGTTASPTASQLNDRLFSLVGFGYGATGFAGAAKIAFNGYASENWTDAAQGTYVTVETTPTGSTTRGVAATFGQDKSLTIAGTTASTSTTTGSFIAGGGAGIAGALFAASFNHSVDRSALFTNQTSSAAAQTGTLLNAPAAGNPGFWLRVTVNATNYAIPCWAG